MKQSVGMSISLIDTRHSRLIASKIDGYTLLELLVVLAVIGAVLSVMPMLLSGRFGEDNVATITEQLIADLRLARGEAVASNAPASLVIDSSHDGYVLLPSRQHRQLPEGIRIALTSKIGRAGEGVSFFPDGTSTGGQLHVELGDDIYAIDVSWPTGRIRLGE